MSKQSGQVSLAKDYLRGATKQLEKAKAAGVDLSALVPLLTALIELAVEVLPGVLKRDELEEAIEKAAKELPVAWRMTIEMDAGRVNCDLYDPSGEMRMSTGGTGRVVVGDVAVTLQEAIRLTSALTPRG